MDCKPSNFSGTEGPVGLLHWIEKTESVLAKCNCPAADKVKFATGTLEGTALTWWNSQVQMLGVDVANATPWDEFKDLLKEEYCPRDEIQKLETEFYNLKMVGSEIEAYTTRSHELATMCPNLSNPPFKRIELYIKGLVPQIRSLVTSAHTETIHQTIRMAHKLTNEAVEQGILPKRGASSSSTTATTAGDNKRKWDATSDKTNSQNQQQQKRVDGGNRGNQSSGSSGRADIREICPSATCVTIITQASVPKGSVTGVADLVI